MLNVEHEPAFVNYIDSAATHAFFPQQAGRKTQRQTKSFRCNSGSLAMLAVMSLRASAAANDILRAAGTVEAAEEEPNSELVVKVVLPVLLAAEREFGQALSRINLDDLVRHAALNGNGTGRDESGVTSA